MHNMYEILERMFPECCCDTCEELERCQEHRSVYVWRRKAWRWKIFSFLLMAGFVGYLVFRVLH